MTTIKLDPRKLLGFRLGAAASGGMDLTAASAKVGAKGGAVVGGKGGLT